MPFWSWILSRRSGRCGDAKADDSEIGTTLLKLGQHPLPGLSLSGWNGGIEYNHVRRSVGGGVQRGLPVGRFDDVVAQPFEFARELDDELRSGRRNDQSRQPFIDHRALRVAGTVIGLGWVELGWVGLAPKERWADTGMRGSKLFEKDARGRPLDRCWPIEGGDPLESHSLQLVLKAASEGSVRQDDENYPMCHLRPWRQAGPGGA